MYIPPFFFRFFGQNLVGGKCKGRGEARKVVGTCGFFKTFLFLFSDHHQTKISLHFTKFSYTNTQKKECSVIFFSCSFGRSSTNEKKGGEGALCCARPLFIGFVVFFFSFFLRKTLFLRIFYFFPSTIHLITSVVHRFQLYIDTQSRVPSFPFFPSHHKKMPPPTVSDPVDNLFQAVLFSVFFFFIFSNAENNNNKKIT